MSAILTYKRLRAAGACAGQLALFRKMFGDQVEITEALCVEHAHTFNFFWAADHLLHEPAWQAYYAARVQARQAYDDAIAPARQAYDAAIAQAEQAYYAAIAQAWARAFIEQEAKS